MRIGDEIEKVAKLEGTNLRSARSVCRCHPFAFADFHSDAKAAITAPIRCFPRRHSRSDSGTPDSPIANTALCPGQEFERSWHIEAIAYHLEQVRRGEIKRLIINMPPRSLKSISASVAFPAFVLGRDPTSRFICVSYSGDLAKKHSNDFRALVEAPWYRSVFPNTRIGPYKNAETEDEFTARGFRLATSVGGTLTGRGGDIIVIADPLKPDDAYSQARRNAANEWFKSTLLSRLDDKRTGAIVIVMQRVHMDDLTGFVLSMSNEWEVLNLPAIAEGDEDVPTSATKVYHRKAGQALSPVREPLSVLENLKVQL